MPLPDIAKLAFYNPLKMLGIDPAVFVLQFQDNSNNNQDCTPSSGESAGVPLIKVHFDGSSGKFIVRAEEDTVVP